MLMRYLWVGVLATALHYAILIGVVERLHRSPALGAGLGALAGAVLAYLGNRRFTFAASTAAHAQALPRFMLIAAGMALGHAAIVWCGSSVLGLHYLVAQVLASGTAFLCGFQLNKSWSFA
jgi:putative flippase GtrA